jgi:hypothetical protein
LYELFDVEPTLINVISARGILGIKVPKGLKKTEKKPFILQGVRNMNIVPESKWQYKKTRNAKR